MGLTAITEKMFQKVFKYDETIQVNNVITENLELSNDDVTDITSKSKIIKPENNGYNMNNSIKAELNNRK